MGCLNSVDGLSAWPSTCQTTARYATSRNSAEQSEPHYENILLEELLDIHKYSTKLVLINRNLNDQDMKILATYIKINQFLNQLDLTSNEITCTGVVYLMEAILNFNSTLTEISFSNNQLGDIGVKILALYLKTSEPSDMSRKIIFYAPLPIMAVKALILNKDQRKKNLISKKAQKTSASPILP
ncbi:unnamed protein product [Didymodactylos carnosus]|uniref:Uncharacterized protein n=1 Tax=Didymodactylos carnosus TaxID=1234261 RepID=A0A815ZLZ7_9BILA|nr:unnamed protein product [Didymodactylos carnosus]CAF4452522.1 unnamed protein product [Didymodactylos carnosus]